MCDGEIAGFSLLRRYPLDKSSFDIGQFFVLSKFKNKGVGRKAFELSVSGFPGKWVVRVLQENVPSLPKQGDRLAVDQLLIQPINQQAAAHNHLQEPSR